MVLYRHSALNFRSQKVYNRNKIGILSGQGVSLGKFPTAEAVYLAISGMTCPHCAVYINNALQQLGGVLLSFMLVEQTLVALLYDPGQTSEAEMVNFVSGLNDGQHHFHARAVAHASAADIFA